MAASSAVPVDDAPLPGRTSARSSEIAALTGLRGFSALMVVLIHSSGRTDYPGFGLQGYGPVSLFVLSGFLLYRPWARWSMRVADRPSVRSFARRRLARIFPAYLLVVLVVAIAYPPSQPPSPGGWLRLLTLTNIYGPRGSRPGLEQTWSLGTELSWYVALPVMGLFTGWLARRLAPVRAWWLIAGFLLLSLPVTAAWRWWVYVEDLGSRFTYSFWLPGFLVCFAGGALVSHVVVGGHTGAAPWRRLRAVAGRPWLLLVFATIVAAIGTSSLGGPDLYTPSTFYERQVRFVCASIVALTLLVIVVLGRPDSPLSRLFSTRAFNAFGRWSYGVYLWHLPVIVLLEDDFVLRDGPFGFALWLSFILAVSTALGAATYAWVEKPAIARSKRGG